MDDEAIARVRQVIEASGHTQRDFASRIGLEETKLTKSLNGKRRFSSLELALIADVGDRTVEWILTGVDPRSMVFAHRAGLLDVDEADAAAEEILSVASERFDGLVAIGYAPDPVELPTRPTGRSYVRGSNALAEQAAMKLSSRVSRLSTEALIDEIESMFGINVIVAPLPGGVDGISYQDGDFRAIVLAATGIAVRQRYTLAHELGHILWGDARLAVIEENVSGNANETEKRANVFAASFTVPRAELLERLDGRDPKDAFDALTCEFGVSPTSMSWRLLNLGLITAGTQAILGARTAAQCAEAADYLEKHLESNRASLRPRPPMRLATAAVRAYLDGESTVKPASQLLGYSEDETRRMLSTTPLDDFRAENPEG